MSYAHSRPYYRLLYTGRNTLPSSSYSYRSSPCFYLRRGFYYRRSSCPCSFSLIERRLAPYFSFLMSLPSILFFYLVLSTRT